MKNNRYRVPKEHGSKFHELKTDKGWDWIMNQLNTDATLQKSEADELFNSIQNDRKVRGLEAERKQLQQKYNYVLKQLENSENRFDILAAIKEPVNVFTLNYEQGKVKNEAAAIVTLSDWHCEEKVDKHTVNGLNEYNPDIAKKRAVTCIQNAVKLARKERSDVQLDTLVLWLGGDFITGQIHPELIETNYMSPTEAIRFAKQLLISGIEFIIQHGGFKKIIVQCQDGNHGRIQVDKRVSSRHLNSYEYMMYLDIADYFKRYDCIEFNIPQSIISYVSVLGKTIRTFHGDGVRFGGGIGGLTIPLNKMIHRLDTQMPADYNLIGHYHQFSEPTKTCMLNGSLIGFNAYAQQLGCAPEPAIQGFRLLDAKRGFTAKYPIFCD